MLRVQPEDESVGLAFGFERGTCFRIEKDTMPFAVFVEGVAPVLARAPDGVTDSINCHVVSAFERQNSMDPDFWQQLAPEQHTEKDAPRATFYFFTNAIIKSGWPDLNRRPFGPEPNALANCATARKHASTEPHGRDNLRFRGAASAAMQGVFR